jgi:hypothetical protein
MQEAGSKKRYRLDKTRCNEVTRYELLENGRFVCAFDAADLPRVTALLMEAEGARQGLALRFPPVDPDGLKVCDCPACGVSNAVLEDDAGWQCRACYARFGEDAFDDWRDGLDPRDWPEVETPAATLAAHVQRLCACLGEAVAFAEAVSPGTGHNAGLWAQAITEAQALRSAPPSASNREPVGDWRPHLARLAQRYGNEWPGQALERLLQLTEVHGYRGAWSEDAQVRAEQEERLALHRWAREVIEAGVAFQQKPW